MDCRRLDPEAYFQTLYGHILLSYHMDRAKGRFLLNSHKEQSI
jgi:hypothetical protein